MVKRYIPKGYTKDTFVNFLASVGIGTDNVSTGGTYGFNPISRNRVLMEWTYRGSWLCGKAVDCIANDMTMEGIDILSELKPDKIDKIQAALVRKQIWQSLNQVAKWARLYGGALGYIRIKDQDPSTPLRIDTIKKGQFEGIITLDRWMVNPDLTRSVMVAGPDFGYPEYYDVIATSFQFPFPRIRIHYSRLIRMEGIELPFNQKQAENMWGISVLERVWDRMLAFDSTTQGAAQLAYKAYLRTIKIKDLRQVIASGGKAYEALLKQISTIRQFQANEGITLLDGNDEFEAHSYTFSGLNEVIDKMGEQVAGACDTPLTRLLGVSPGGLNSDGESAQQNYENTIKREQERWFRRPLDVLLQVVSYSEGIGELPEGTTFEFRSIRQLTELQKSEMNANDTAALVSAASNPSFKSATFLKELRHAGKRTGYYSNITDEDIKDAEEADELPDPSEMGLLPGPGGNARPGQPQAGKKALPAPAKAPFPLKRGETPGSGTRDAGFIRDVQGFPVFIETPKGAIRQGKDWRVKMNADYGYIEGIGSAEGAFEQLDCYVGNEPDSDKVFVIDQLNLATGAFDEHKCMLAFKDKGEAVDTYARSFHDGKGADRIGGVTELSVKGFSDWMARGDMRFPHH